MACEVKSNNLNCVHFSVDAITGTVDLAEAALTYLPDLHKFLVESTRVKHCIIADWLLGLLDLPPRTVWLVAQVKSIERFEASVLNSAVRTGWKSLHQLQAGPLLAATGVPFCLG